MADTSGYGGGNYKYSGWTGNSYDYLDYLNRLRDYLKRPTVVNRTPINQNFQRPATGQIGMGEGAGRLGDLSIDRTVLNKWMNKGYAPRSWKTGTREQQEAYNQVRDYTRERMNNSSKGYGRQRVRTNNNDVPSGNTAAGQLGNVSPQTPAKSTWKEWFKNNLSNNDIVPYSSSIYGKWNPNLGLGGNGLANTNRYRGGEFSGYRDWFDEMQSQGNTYKGKTWQEVNLGGANGSPFTIADDPAVMKFNPYSPTFDPNTPFGTKPPMPDYTTPPNELPNLPDITGGGGGYNDTMPYYDPGYGYDDWGGWGGGGGYYGGGGNTRVNYNTEYNNNYRGGGGMSRANDINKWYANMVQWNIGKARGA